MTKVSLPIGWERKKLRQVCEIEKNKYLSNNLAYVGMEDIESDTGVFTGSLSACDVKSSTFKFTSQHLLYGRLRPYLNKVLLPDFEGHCSTEIFPIKPKDNLSRQFLFYWFTNNETVDAINQTCTGARMPRANLKDVMEFDFSLPPIPEQQRIVGILDKAFIHIATTTAHAEQNLSNARELFDSTLNIIFTEKGEGWVEKTLGKIADVEYGYTDKSTEEGDFRYVRITDVDKNGELIRNNKKYIKYSKEAESFLVEDNDLLMARTGATFAKVLLYKDYEPSVFASYLIRIKFKENIENELYWHFTKTKFYWEQANNLKSGAAQPHFNGAAVKQVIFTYPKSLMEQKTLIQKFKALSVETKRLEAIYQQKLDALAELKQSLLQQAFAGEL